MKLDNCTKNRLGTVSFDGLFQGMRKKQSFIVYPISNIHETGGIKIQSDTRIGFIDLSNGRVMLTPAIQSGAHNLHLRLVKFVGSLTGEDLFLLKANIASTSSKTAGTAGIQCDNSRAIKVLSVF